MSSAATGSSVISKNLAAKALACDSVGLSRLKSLKRSSSDLYILSKASLDKALVSADFLASSLAAK